MHHGGLNMKHKTVSTIAAILCGTGDTIQANGKTLL